MTIEELYQLYLNYPSVQIDTRKLKKGELFFALRGPSFNGNEFVAMALEKEAEYAIIDDEKYSIPKKTILVPNVLDTLQKLALHHRKQFSIPFIAITGSNGKTTTKELIHVVLSTVYKTYTTFGNLNNHIGVPLTILNIKSDAQIAVIEMGANHLKEIAAYCTIAQPTHGLITNCGKAHLEGFGGIEGVRKGKGELYDYMKTHNGTAFVMWDYNYLREMSAGMKEIITYGTKDAKIEGESFNSGSYLGVSFKKGINALIYSKLVGDYNLPNVLAAGAIGNYFNISDEQIKSSIESYQPGNSRSQLISKGENEIILDAYNANPTSMKLAIENFARSNGNQKVLVLGSMAELGDESLQEHKNILVEIEKYAWHQVILVGEQFRVVNNQFLCFNTSEDAGKWLEKNKKPNSIYLIKGSRSMQMEKVMDYL